jgi:hypothetical protein
MIAENQSFIFQLFIFAVAGLYFPWRSKTRPDFFPKWILNNPVMFTIGVGLFLILISLGLYALTGDPEMRVSLASSCAFVLPCLIQETWKRFCAIRSTGKEAPPDTKRKMGYPVNSSNGKYATH